MFTKSQIKRGSLYFLFCIFVSTHTLYCDDETEPHWLKSAIKRGIETGADKAVANLPWAVIGGGITIIYYYGPDIINGIRYYLNEETRLEYEAQQQIKENEQLGALLLRVQNNYELADHLEKINQDGDQEHHIFIKNGSKKMKENNMQALTMLTQLAKAKRQAKILSKD